MSFSLPALKIKPGDINSSSKFHGEYEVANVMVDGLGKVHTDLEIAHPLKSSEAKYSTNRHNLNMTILRNTQGLHAPLKIGMELNAAKKIGRLPCMSSSNIMLETLTGRDIEMGPEDIFNQHEYCEVMGQPHAVIEKSLGLI